ncbi:hypothetical protein niasHT_008662 [Heterodera trifolii]|uniref:ubiquitinyl hydrolase 1 n=1 Tax=Heterodera trifolii TaxID=157864 RepID=A0ABD2LWZ3_9BILA
MNSEENFENCQSQEHQQKATTPPPSSPVYNNNNNNNDGGIDNGGTTASGIVDGNSSELLADTSGIGDDNGTTMATVGSSSSNELVSNHGAGGGGDDEFSRDSVAGGGSGDDFVGAPLDEEGNMYGPLTKEAYEGGEEENKLSFDGGNRVKTYDRENVYKRMEDNNNAAAGMASSSSTTSNSAPRPYSTRYSQAMLNSSSNDLMRGVCGLQNLGNTCFMNSAIQCLSNVPELTTFFLEDNYVDEVNTSNPLGTGGRLVKQYADLLKDMWSGRFSSVRPYELKQIIGEIAPRFTGHAQHDSQELTAFLLDGLHEDLNRIKQKPYVEEKELSGQDEAQAAKQSWEDYRKRNDSIIVDLLHGQHKSTLTCNVCSKISIKFEPFCFLSVPVPTKELKAQSTLVFMRAEKWAKFHVSHTSKTTAGQLKQMLREELQLPSNTQMIIYSTYSNRILKDDSTLSSTYMYNYSVKLYAYTVEPGPVILVENLFMATSPPLFFPRPAKLTRRALLAELVPRVRELCLSLSPTTTTAVEDCGDPGTSSASAAPSSSYCTALIPALPASFSSPSSSLSMSSSSTTTMTPPTMAQPPVIVSSSGTSSSSSYLSLTGGGTQSSPQAPGSGGTTARRAPSGTRLSGGGPGSPTIGAGAAVASAADLPSSSSLSSPQPSNAAGHIVDTSATGDAALDDVVPSPLTPAASTNDAIIKEDAQNQQQQQPNVAADDDTPQDMMMDTSENDEHHQHQPGAEGEMPPPPPTPSLIELLDIETNEKMTFPLDMDEEVTVQWPENATIGTSVTDGDVPAAPIILKLCWDRSVRTRFESMEVGHLVEREVTMMASLKKSYTLKECIDMYTQQEQLNEEDSWYCPNCKTHRRAFKKLDLWTLPQILVIHLKRFSYGRYTRDKIETELELPIRGLDFSDKVLNPEHSQEKYDLIGISNHSGGLGSGHYSACALNGSNWCEFNDSSAYPLQHEVPDVFNSREAYMLYYRRRGEQQPQQKRHGSEEEDGQQQPQQQPGEEEEEQMLQQHEEGKEDGQQKQN